VLTGGLNFQWIYASIFLVGEKFCDKHRDLVIIYIVIIIVVSILSLVLPYILKEANEELYLIGLIFFIVEYYILFSFY
jgi:hypothetical protein